MIPTRGQPAALAALDSALAQTVTDLEVVVVYDGDADEFPLDLGDDPRVRLVATGKPSGAGPARSLGAREAKGRYVAFLDDDDTWLPTKLEQQLAAADAERREHSHVLVSSRVRLSGHAGVAELVVPTRLIGSGEPVADYLFTRRRVRYGGSLLHTSTLLCDRELAVSTPWRDLAVHQDWDWVLRATEDGTTAVRMLPEPLVNVAETAGSVSRSGKWRASRDWADESRARLGDRQWADLLLCTTAPFARADHQRWEALKIGLAAMRRGRPGPPAITFFVLSQLGPRDLLTRLARARVRRTLGAGLRRWSYLATHPQRLADYPSWRRDRKSSPLSARKPWICYPAADYLQSRLRPGMRAFEFGGGGSTLWLQDHGIVVTTVEHVPDWHRAVADASSEPTRVLLVPAQTQGRVRSEVEDGFFDAYVTVLERVADEQGFDCILVDGRCRAECLVAARPYVRPGGVILLDDSRRERYHRAVTALADWPHRTFTGLKPGDDVVSSLTIWQRPA